MSRAIGTSAEMKSVSQAAAPLLERIAEIRASIPPERKAEIAAAVAERVALDERKAVLAVGMPSIFDRTPIEAAPPRARAWAAGAVTGGRRNLVLVGASGTGKTKAACALLAWMATRRPCRFATLGDMLRECRATYGGEGSEWAVLAKWAGVGVLCLDDLGKERPTADSADKLFALVDKRYGDGKPTIFTTQYAGPRELGLRLMEGCDKPTAQAIARRVYGDGDRIAEVVTLAR